MVEEFGDGAWSDTELEEEQREKGVFLDTVGGARVGDVGSGK